MSEDSFQMKLSKLLFAEYPELLNSDVKSSANAAFELSNLMGCVMAAVLVKRPDQYEEAMKTILMRVHDSACKTANKAHQMTINTTLQ